MRLTTPTGPTSVPSEPRVRIRSYSDDYAGWAEDTARAIEEGRFAEIDPAALADEVRSLSGSEQSRLESALRVLLIHMLKVKYQPEKHTRNWDLTIAVQRVHIRKFLKTSPSLRARLDELIADAYETARYDAENQTGIFFDTLPETCEWTDAEILEDHT
jgi:Domain of unknown function DUF29